MTDEILEEQNLAEEETEEAEEAVEDVAGEEPEEVMELDDDEAVACVEAILFTMGKSVEIEKIAYALNVDMAEARRIIDLLNEDYRSRKRGMYVNFLEDSVQLCTKRDYYPELIRIATKPVKPTLTPTVLETLSIVAYKQPVTKADIERIRGVKSDFAVNKLVEYGLIEEVGRLETPGRPILFATTEEFLRRFGLNSVNTLPQADPEQIEEFVSEAQQEITI